MLRKSIELNEKHLSCLVTAFVYVRLKERHQEKQINPRYNGQIFQQTGIMRNDRLLTTMFEFIHIIIACRTYGRRRKM